MSMGIRVLSRCLLLVSLLVASIPCLAAEIPAVVALQSPAWVQRDGYNQALRSDFSLRQGDVIRTGATGRVHLRMPDGSLVKLGAGAELRIEGLVVREDDAGELFDGVLRVIKGAFRFTTSVVDRASTRRDVRVHIGTATAGIRGTDIWGSSDAERDLICLLEGEIAVRAGGYAPQIMDRPLQFFVVPHGQPPQPIGSVDPARVRDVWAPQTELMPDRPITSDGAWAVVLGSYTVEESAVELTERMGVAGYPARIAVIEIYGQTYYRVVVTGFPGLEQARAYIDQVASGFGADDAWPWQVRSPR